MFVKPVQEHVLRLVPDMWRKICSSMWLSDQNIRKTNKLEPEYVELI